MPSRRAFLQSAAALAAAVPAPAAETLPIVPFGKYRITRLIVGSNPFYGYSHFNRIFDQCMRDWYTQDRRMEILHACERQGINTWQVHYNDQPVEDIKRYRAEGGRMNIVILADFDLMKNPKLIPEAAKLGISIGHHGGRTDERFRSGQKQLVRDYLKTVRDSGATIVTFSKSWPKRAHYALSGSGQVMVYSTLASGELPEFASMPHDRADVSDCLIDDETKL